MTTGVTPSGAPSSAGGIEQLLSNDEARKLVRAAQEYDERALTRLYNLFADRIFRYIYSRVGDRNRAEELTSDVFLRLIEGIGNFRFGAKGHTLALTGWIYRIARNLIIDDYRHAETWAQKERSRVLNADSREFDAPLDFHLTRADLQMALAQLTEEQQTVIVLRFEEGLTCAQIATIIGKPETAVKALQRRGLAALARWFATEPAAASRSGVSAE